MAGSFEALGTEQEEPSHSYECNRVSVGEFAAVTPKAEPRSLPASGGRYVLRIRLTCGTSAVTFFLRHAGSNWLAGQA